MLLLWAWYLYFVCAVSQFRCGLKGGNELQTSFTAALEFPKNLFIANDIFDKRVWIATIPLARLRLVSGHVDTLKDVEYA